MRTEPCKQCNAFDFYERGDFSYCRPCHADAQKRYVQRKAAGDEVTVKSPPSRALHEQNYSASKRLTCKNGHPQTKENVRQSSQRGGKHVFNRCRACQRDEKRVKYGVPAEPRPVKLTELLDQEHDT